MPKTEHEKKMRDSWSTPDDFMRAIKKAWFILPTIDVCATEENTKCEYYFDEAMDALAIDWVASADMVQVDPIFWCNPGYSNVTPWAKAAMEVAENGGTTYLLTHDNYNSEWFRTLYDSPLCVRMLLLQPRIAFIPAEGVKSSTPRGNNMLHIISSEEVVARQKIIAMNWKEW